MTKFQRIVVALSVALIALSATAFAEGKIDPLLNIMADSPDAALSQMKAFGTKAVEGVVMTDVIIGAAEGKAEEAKAFIENLGGNVRLVIGDIMTASIPLDAIGELDDSELIAAVEAAKPLTAKVSSETTDDSMDSNWEDEDALDSTSKMNAARGSTGSNADQVQAGTCTGCSPGTGGYTGTNVIVGIVDSGIDCQHADFKNSTGTTRIINYLDQTTTPSTDYTSAQLADGTCSGSPDTGAHGTHVAGIAAGSNATYTGVASTSSIIAVKMPGSDANSGGTFSTYILEGTNYIFTKADAAYKAAVVNLSVGTSLGAHDGTSLLEQGLDGLLMTSGTEKKGRAIVNAAGNENIGTVVNDQTTNYGGIHAKINVAAATKGFEVGVMSADASTSIITNSGGAIIDFWLNSGTDCTVEVKGYKKAGGATFTTTPVAFGAATATGADSSAKVTLSYTETAASGKKHGVVAINRLNDSINANILFDYYFIFILSGTCTGDAWLYPDQTGLLDFSKVPQVLSAVGYTYTPGDSDKTITIPGTASKVITVASFMDRNTWVDINGATQNQTSGECGATGTVNLNISQFSSIGPTTNTSDLQKPDIAAPGEPILSTLSSQKAEATADCSKGDATHYKLEGTSMASPHVAGTVALMFQKNNCLTSSNVKSYIRSSATVDASTGSTLPTYAWGYGKLNAAAVMNLFSADTSCYVTPTPSASGSGCSLSNMKSDVRPSSILAVCLALSAMLLGLYGVSRKHRRSCNNSNCL